jgi:hypothetical protein
LSDSAAKARLLFLRYEVDRDGHAYQLLALGEETLEFYPPLDPFSVEHALEVERTILPAIVALYEDEPDRPAFGAFHGFFERLRRIRGGDPGAVESLDPAEARVLEAVRASVNEHTPAEEIRRRAFARFYQHATCDNDRYRSKVRESLDLLVTRLGELHAGG